MTAGERFESVAIIGLGLLGGSVALAVRRAGLADRIVAASRRRRPLERALERGVIDELAVDVREAVSGADLVVLATPLGRMEEMLLRAAPALSPGTLVTDVGSVKGTLADRLPGLLPEGVHYVGAHPMAGSHEKGFDHARADLFDEACCVITPIAGGDPRARSRVKGFWQGLGARVVERDPEAHDVEVAWVSHLPHALSFAFARAFAEAPDTAAELIGSGFRDFTRIAHSDSDLWCEILGANRKALAGPLETCRRALDDLSRAIEEADADAQERFLAMAQASLPGGASRTPTRKARERVAGNARSGGAIPEIQAGPEGPADPRSVEKVS